MKNLPVYSADLYSSTDYQKTFAFGFGVSGYRAESGGYDVSLYPEIEWKPTAGMKVRFAPQFFHDLTIAQWVTNVNDPTATNTFGARYVFARLDQKELSASIRLDLTFTPKLSLQVYVQPLISVGKYSDFKELARARTFTFNKFGDNGSTIAFTEGTYTVDPDGEGPAVPFSFSNPDFNFKSLRGNAVLRWEYMPGSTLYLVWQQSRVNLDDVGTFRFGRDLSHVFSSQPENVFLIKASYWWNP
jgi:hypothetical protein